MSGYVEISEQYVYYAAESRLQTLALEVAQSRSITKPEIKAKIEKATFIRLWLEALDYGQYLDRATREKIWYKLADIAEVNAYPVTITTSNISAPSLIVGIQGPRGTTGSNGATGGGTAFSATSVGSDQVVDSFDISLTTAAEWQYEVYDATNKRVERLTGGWLADGSQFTDDGGLATTDIGDTSGITFAVNIDGTTAQLVAFVTSGTWEVRGSRVLIPVTGNGITLPTALANGKVWIGDSSNAPIANTISGDISITNTGVASIGTGVIVNADINTSAAIAVSKLAVLTASKAVVTDSNGFLTTSVTAASKVAYLANVTSDIQTQIDAIAAAGSITGAITTYVTSNATASRVVVSNPAGKLTTSAVTSTELGYVGGVTSAIQTQLGTKLTDPLTTNGDIVYRAAGVTTRLPVGSAAQVLTVSGGLPSWQNPVAGFADPMTTIGDIMIRNGSNVTARLAIGSSTQVLTVTGGVPTWSAIPAIANNITGTLVAGRVTFASGTNTVTDDSDLTFNTTGNILSLTSGALSGGATPLLLITESGNQNITLRTHGSGGIYLDSLGLFLGSPSDIRAGNIQVLSASANADLSLSPKQSGSGSGFAGTGTVLMPSVGIGISQPFKVDASGSVFAGGGYDAYYHQDSPSVDVIVLRKTKIIEIGDWDMDSTVNVDIPHGLPTDAWKKAQVKIMIFDDAGTTSYPIEYFSSLSAQAGISGSYFVDATNVTIYRVTSGAFDNTGFDSTSYNRGLIFIEYIYAGI